MPLTVPFFVNVWNVGDYFAAPCIRNKVGNFNKLENRQQDRQLVLHSAFSLNTPRGCLNFTRILTFIVKKRCTFVVIIHAFRMRSCRTYGCKSRWPCRKWHQQVLNIGGLKYLFSNLRGTIKLQKNESCDKFTNRVYYTNMFCIISTKNIVYRYI